MIKCTDEEIKSAALSSITAAEAAAKLGIQYQTYRNHAKRLGVFTTNASGRGLKKQIPSISLIEILKGNHPSYQSNKLRIRLIKEGIKEQLCEECGIIEWNGKPISLELEHIDGNHNNHLLSNLKILCPNCHSQTMTYRGRNRSKP